MKTHLVKKLFFISVISITFCQVNGQTNTAAAKSATDLVKEAKKEIENLTPAQVNAELVKGDVTLIDVREPDESTQNGEIEGAINAPRGMLEFYADSSTPYYKPVFDKSKRIILHCASGGRSALAASTLKQMGYKNVAHLDGGLKAWKEAGMPVKK